MTRYLVVWFRDGVPQVYPFEHEEHARMFYTEARAAWSEVFLCDVLAGPGSAHDRDLLVPRLDVFNVIPYDLENGDGMDLMLFAAPNESTAKQLWLEYSGEDYSLDDLRSERLTWQWPGVAEPEVPTIPRPWLPEGFDADGLELWRGYGLTEINDPLCEGCCETVPPQVMGDDGYCADCVAKGNVDE